MDRVRFEDIAEEAFNHLPALFKKKIENVEIVVEDAPASSGQHSFLLGLYHGVPLTRRGPGTACRPSCRTEFPSTNTTSRGSAGRTKKSGRKFMKSFAMRSDIILGWTNDRCAAQCKSGEVQGANGQF